MWTTLLMTALLATARSKQIPVSTELATTAIATVTPATEDTTPLDTLSVHCGKESMDVTITPAHLPRTRDARFNGIVYPTGLGSNSSCLREYVSRRGDLQYSVPLRGCNTMSIDNDDDTIEYYNNIIVQPHLKLVTGQGRGYHVRCRYRRRDLSQFHVYPKAARLTSGDTNSIDETYDLESGWMPSVSMKIFKGDPKDKHVASEVQIGDSLTMVVSLEKQQEYGLLVSECTAADGLGADVSLIANDGCPLDGEIMGMFQYSTDKQQASVSFGAYRFPHSASVYFTCEVKLCQLNHPTDCVSDIAVFDATVDAFITAEPCTHKTRSRRDTDDEGQPATVEVFSGLFVNEADSQESDDVTSEKKEDEICISQRNFAIGICIAGIILMICVIAAIACILARRRNPKTYSRTGSSLYSGPYTNTGYSHTS